MGEASIFDGCPEGEEGTLGEPSGGGELVGWAAPLKKALAPLAIPVAIQREGWVEGSPWPRWLTEESGGPGQGRETAGGLKGARAAEWAPCSPNLAMLSWPSPLAEGSPHSEVVSSPLHARFWRHTEGTSAQGVLLRGPRGHWAGGCLLAGLTRSTEACEWRLSPLSALPVPRRPGEE